MAALVVNAYVSSGALAVALYRGTLLNSTWEPILWYSAVGVAGPGIGRITLLTHPNYRGRDVSRLLLEEIVPETDGKCPGAAHPGSWI